MGVDTNAMRCFARVRNMCSTVGSTALSSVLDAAADEIDALRAEVERLKTKAEIGEFVMEAVRQSARNKSTITAIVRLKEAPCKP